MDLCFCYIVSQHSVNLILFTTTSKRKRHGRQDRQTENPVKSITRLCHIKIHSGVGKMPHPPTMKLVFLEQFVTWLFLCHGTENVCIGIYIRIDCQRKWHLNFMAPSVEHFHNISMPTLAIVNRWSLRWVQSAI